MNPPGANNVQQQAPAQQQLGPNQQDYVDYQTNTLGQSSNNAPGTLPAYETVPVDEGVDITASKWKSLINIANNIFCCLSEMGLALQL